MVGNKFEKTLMTKIPRIITGISKTLNIDRSVATSIFYTSRTYALLSDYNTGLWHQDVAYILNVALSELNMVTFC